MNEVPAVVSSSRPSSPEKTNEYSLPSERSTPIIRSAIRASATPTACRVARAGLASGPNTLKTVGTPSSPRTGAASRIAGW